MNPCIFKDGTREAQAVKWGLTENNLFYGKETSFKAKLQLNLIPSVKMTLPRFSKGAQLFAALERNRLHRSKCSNLIVKMTITTKKTFLSLFSRSLIIIISFSWKEPFHSILFAEIYHHVYNDAESDYFTREECLKSNQRWLLRQ